MENSKELFIKAFMEAERIDNSYLKSEEEIEWDFSEKFESSMNKLIKKNNHIKLSTRRKIRIGFIAAIIAIIIMFTGLMSVTAIRTPFVEIIKKVTPGFTELELSKESTPPVDTIETEYTLTNIPEGFEIKSYQKEEYSVFVIWVNDKGEELVFSQDLLDSVWSIDNDYNYRELEINGYTAYFNDYGIASSLTWTDGIYWFHLSVPSSANEDVLSMAENISEKN